MAMANSRYLPPTVRAKAEFMADSTTTRIPAKSLSETEESVLKLMLSGYDETDIARILGLPLESVNVLSVSLCVRLIVIVGDGSSRSPRVVQALVKLCVS